MSLTVTVYVLVTVVLDMGFEILALLNERFGNHENVKPPVAFKGTVPVEQLKQRLRMGHVGTRSLWI